MTARENMQVLAKMYRGKQRSKHRAKNWTAAASAPKPVPVRGREGKTFVVKGLRP